MNCKEAQQQIKLYIEGEMDRDDLQEFMQHIDTCEDCHDELEIQFLVKEGLARLEDGSTFDLGNELKEKISSSKRFVFVVEKARLGIYILEVVAGMALTACFVMLFTVMKW